jgi:hypothetical protein
VGFLAIVDVRDLDGLSEGVRAALVGEKIVTQAIDERARALMDVAPRAVARVALENGDDFVVGFAAIDQVLVRIWFLNIGWLKSTIRKTSSILSSIPGTGFVPWTIIGLPGLRSA